MPKKTGYKPVKIPPGVKGDTRAAMKLINKWAKWLEQWGYEVQRHVGHDTTKAKRSSSHLVGDPPHPPFEN